ncbi:MAG: putative nucleotidyltransferase component of viral defense system [Cyclobacteriaceae bacterium]
MAGGTALALQIGHRISIDLDFFSEHGFDEKHLVNILERDYNASIISQYENTVLTNIEGVKVDIISHQYEQLSKSSVVDGIRMASKDDIAAMKLNAVVNRGAKKDFVDIFFLLHDYSLNQLITLHNRKYPNQNELLVLKSLTYFADADLD